LTSYKRVGRCNRCGACCRIDCPHFYWEALKDIKRGETFKSGLQEGFIKANCEVFHSSLVLSYCNPNVRLGFPFEPSQVSNLCGFKFVKVKANGSK